MRQTRSTRSTSPTTSRTQTATGAPLSQAGAAPTPQQPPDTTRRTQWTADLAIVTETHQAHGWPTGKVADATLEWTAGPLAGLKLIGFAVWQGRAGGHNVTFPARQYSVNGERRSFALLRPITDVRGQETLRDAIIATYLGTLTPYDQQAPGRDRAPIGPDQDDADLARRDQETRAQAFPMLPLLADEPTNGPAPANEPTPAPTTPQPQPVTMRHGTDDLGL